MHSCCHFVRDPCASVKRGGRMRPCKLTDIRVTSSSIKKFCIQNVHATHVELEHVVDSKERFSLFIRVENTNRLSRSISTMEAPEHIDVYPLLAYRPVILHSTIVEMGRIRDCFFHVHTNCVVEGSISYRYILECIDPNAHAPCFVVSYEESMLHPSDCFFCTFAPSSRSNLGLDYVFDDVQAFAVKALELADEYLSSSAKEILASSLIGVS